MLLQDILDSFTKKNSTCDFSAMVPNVLSFSAFFFFSAMVPNVLSLLLSFSLY